MVFFVLVSEDRDIKARLKSLVKVAENQKVISSKHIDEALAVVGSGEKDSLVHYVFIIDSRVGNNDSWAEIPNLIAEKSFVRYSIGLIFSELTDDSIRLDVLSRGFDFSFVPTDIVIAQYLHVVGKKYADFPKDEFQSGKSDSFYKISSLLPGLIFQFQMFPDGRFSFPYISNHKQEKLGGLFALVKDDAQVIFDHIHEDDLPGLLKVIEDSFHSHCKVDYRFRIKGVEGNWIWLQVSTFPELQPDNSIVWYGVATDVSQLIKDVDQNKILSLIAENTDNVVIITDKDRKFEWVNASFTKLTGFSIDEVYGKSPGEVLQGPDPDQQLVSEMRDRFNRGLPYQGEILNYTKTGEPYWIYMDIQPIFEEDGTLFRFIAIQTNITDRKNREEKLRVNEERFRMLAENISEGLIVVDSTGTIEYASPAHQHLYGYPSEELIGSKSIGILNKIHPDDREYWKESLQKAIENKEPVAKVTFRVKAVDGLYRWREDTTKLLYNKQGDLLKSYTLCYDIHKEVLINEELVAERNKIKAILEASPAAIIVINMNEDIIIANHAAEKLFCRKLSDMIHRKCGEFIGCENHGDEDRICGQTKFCNNCRLYAGIRKVLEGGNSMYDQEDRVTIISEGQPRKVWLNFSIESLSIEGKRNAILALTDITRQKEAQNLESKLVIAQKTAAIKQNFLSSMSHEMRTPLNGIIGITDILKKTDLNEDQRQYLKILEDSSDTLLNMINSVLDLSKIESGKISVNEVLIDIKKFCQKITSLFGNIAKTQNISFSCLVDENFPEHFISDENKLNQILNNLLGNAIKFTEKGNITISAKLLRAKEDDFILRFDVVDTGKGIPRERLDDIFDEFTQIDDSKTRKVQGTGLGLAITRNLVNLLGGDIYVESEPGKGSNFWFTIRAMKPSAFSNSRPNLADNDPFSAKDLNLNVLIVEDMKINRLVVTLMLQGLGCKIDTAENGLEALHKVNRNNYDVVLMDIQMPVMDGVTAVKELRNLNMNLPVIIGLSAQAMEGDAEKYISEGMDDYLTKPIKSTILAQKLSYWKSKLEEKDSLSETPM